MEETKIINGYSIYKGGTWCEVTKNGEHIYEGSVDRNMTHEKIYTALTAKLEFRLGGKVLAAYTLYGSSSDEKQSTLELLAYENGCSVYDIEVIKVIENVVN